MGEKKIKILHIDTERTWRGGQQQAIYLLEGLLKRNFSTALVCQPNSAIANYCAQKGLPYFPIRMRNELDFIAGFRIARLCRKFGFNIIHLHSSHSLSIGLWVKIFLPKLKVIAVRRVDFPVSKNIFSRFKYKTGLLTKIVCVSEGVRDVLLSGGIPESKLVVIHSGVALKKFSQTRRSNDFRKRWRIPTDHVLIGTIAAMVGHKDYPNLLHAAKLVLERHSNVTFCAVGDGPDQKMIFELAQELKLNERFIFADFQKDIGVFLKNFDIFVLASSLEGLGSSILDAQALGLPIVATNTGGIPEAVIDNENGLLVPPRSPEKLAEALEKLIVSPELRKKLGENGKISVKKFSIENTIEKNINLYQRLMG